MSGLTGLAYQIIWHKKLVLLLGATSYSITAIFTAFFLGFALGGKLGESILNRFHHPLKNYAIAELVVAIWALLFNLIYAQADTFYQTLSHEYEIGFALRFTICILLILPATIAMGATIPFMIKALENRAKNDNGVPYAYGINTFGAVIGVLCTSFVFLPLWGMNATAIFIFALNISVVGLALVWSRNEVSIENLLAEKKISYQAGAIFFSYFLFGIVAIGFEMVWLRTLGLYTSSGHFMFSTFMACYLLGFSIGSYYLYPKMKKSMTDNYKILFYGSIALVIIIILSERILRFTPQVAQSLIFDSIHNGSISNFKIILSESFPILVVTFIPTIIMGMMYPVFSQLTPRVGTLYCLGNIGSACGAVLVSLLIIPLFGLVQSWGILLLLILIALIILPISNSSRLKNIKVFIVGPLVILIIAYQYSINPFTKFNLSLEADKTFSTYNEYNKNNILVSKILRYKEGEAATVIIREQSDDQKVRRIFIDEQSVAATLLREVIDAKMLAHLPLLIHPADSNQKFLGVGYGSGGTAWSLTRYLAQGIIVEIEKEVIASAHLFPYAKALQDPKLKVEINDARDYLRRVKEKFDIIVTDVTNVQYKQNPNIYTVEYFELMKAALNKDGIACAWIPLAAISPKELKILIASFVKVFPHATLWHMNHVPTTFAVLIAPSYHFSWDENLEKNIQQKMQRKEVELDLKEIFISDVKTIKNFLMLDQIALAKYAKGAPLHTDNHPILEYQSSFSFYRYQDYLDQNLSELKVIRDFN